MRGGKLAEGVAKMKEFLKSHPNDPLADEVQMAIGGWLSGNNDFAAALPEYAQLIAKYPRSALLAQANFKAGWCAWKLSQNADALKFFQQAFALATNPTMARPPRRSFPQGMLPSDGGGDRGARTVVTSFRTTGQFPPNVHIPGKP